MMLALWRNPLEVWSRPHFEKPVLIGKSFMGVRAVVNDPAAVRRVFLDNVANYRKDALQLRVLRPGLSILHDKRTAQTHPIASRMRRLEKELDDYILEQIAA